MDCYQINSNGLKYFNKFGLILKSLFILGCLAGCTRPSEQVSRLRIALPQKMTNQKVGSLNNSELSHIVINITGIEHPIVFNWDGCDNCAIKPPAPVDFPFDVPTGENRMIQVLAIYNGENSDEGGDIYYGDSVVNLKASEETVSISIKSLFENITLTEAQLQGRYLRGVDDGPTGTVLVKYVPPGKPPMTLMKSQIAAGWFNFFITKELNFTYELEDTHEILFDNINMTSSILSNSSKVGHVVVPSYYQSWGNGGEQKKPYNLIVGFWGNPSSENVVCYDQGFTGSLSQMYNDSSKSSALQWGAQVDPAAGIVSVMGGIPYTDSACSIPSKDSKILAIDPHRFGEGDYHSGAVLGMRFPFAAIRWSENGETKERLVRSTNVDANTKNFQLQVLSGLTKYFDTVHVYKFTGPDDFHFKEDGLPCNAIDEGRIPNFSKFQTYALDANGSFIISLAESQIVGVSSFAMCLARGNNLTRLGNLIYLHDLEDNHDDKKLATKIVLSQNSSGPAVFLPNNCLNLRLNFRDTQNNGAYLPDGKSIRIKIKDEQSVSYNLYAGEHCNGSSSPEYLIPDFHNENVSVSLMVPSGLSRNQVSLQPEFISSSDANFAITMVGKDFQKRNATDRRFEIHGPWNIAKDMCYEFNVNLNSYGGSVGIIDPNYTIAVMNITDLESNRGSTNPVFTPNTTVGLYSESTCNSALGTTPPYSLLYSTHKKIWVKVNTLDANTHSHWAVMIRYPGVDMIIDDSVRDFSVDSSMPADYNVTNGFAISGGHNSNNGCLDFSLLPVHNYLDSSNNNQRAFIQMQSAMTINLSMTSGSGGSQASGSFFSDSSCTVAISGGTMNLAAGASAYPVYYKLNTGIAQINNGYLSVTTNGVNFAAYSNIYISSPPNPINISSQFGTWPVNTCESITLTKESYISDQFIVTGRQNNVITGTFYVSSADCSSSTGGLASVTTAVGSWTTNISGKKEYSFYYTIPSSGSVTILTESTASPSTYNATMTITNLYDASNTESGSCNYSANITGRYACVCISASDVWSLVTNKCINNSGPSCTINRAWNGTTCVPYGICAGGAIWNNGTNQCESVFTFENILNGAYYGRVGGRCDTSGIREIYIGNIFNSNPSCFAQNGEYRWSTETEIADSTAITNLAFGGSFTLGIKKQTDVGTTTATFTKQYFTPNISANNLSYPLQFSLLSNSHYIVSGNIDLNTGSGEDLWFKGFNPNGTLDTGFGSGGEIILDGGANQNEYTVNVLSDASSNIYLIGSRVATPIYKFMIRKYTSTGVASGSPINFYDTFDGVPKTSFLNASDLYVFGYDPNVNANNMVTAKYNLTTGSVSSMPTLTDFQPNTVIDLNASNLLLAGRKPSDNTFAVATFDTINETFGTVVTYGTGVAYAARIITYNGNPEILIVGGSDLAIATSDTKIVKLNLALAALFNKTLPFDGGGTADDNRSKAVDVFYNNSTNKIYIVSSIGAQTMKDLGLVGLNIDGTSLAGHGSPDGVKRPRIPIEPISLKPYGNGFIGVGKKSGISTVFKYDLW
jgi:hypothetical protein